MFTGSISAVRFCVASISRGTTWFEERPVIKTALLIITALTFTGLINALVLPKSLKLTIEIPIIGCCCLLMCTDLNQKLNLHWTEIEFAYHRQKVINKLGGESWFLKLPKMTTVSKEQFTHTIMRSSMPTLLDGQVYPLDCIMLKMRTRNNTSEKIQLALMPRALFTHSLDPEWIQKRLDQDPQFLTQKEGKTTTPTLKDLKEIIKGKHPTLELDS